MNSARDLAVRDPRTNRSVSIRSLVALARTLLVALAITFVPQGIWSALIALNLRTTPRIPWAVILVAVVVWLISRHVNVWEPPSDSSEAKRYPLRARPVPRAVLMQAWLAGGSALIALVGYWIVLASLVRMPGSVLPDLSGVPWWTAALAVTTGAALSPLCEQAGLWGYWQVRLEAEFSGPTAIIITAITFAVLPHPPMHAALWPKWIFFFLTGLTFSTMAYLTDSMLPGLAVHALSLLTFFVLVWPFDAHRPLIHQAGADAWFWAHVGQGVLFSLVAYGALRRLSRVTAWAAVGPGRAGSRGAAAGPRGHAQSSSSEW